MSAKQQLTESLEDYLEAIAELIEVEGHAHAKEIAAKLNVKMPSVTGALRQLEKMGCIVYNTHYPVQLTAKGRLIARDVIRRHGILKRFFSEILGLPQDKASETACRLEHIVDADTIRRFVLFSEAIGKRTDARSAGLPDRGAGTAGIQSAFRVRPRRKGRCGEVRTQYRVGRGNAAQTGR